MHSTLSLIKAADYLVIDQTLSDLAAEEFAARPLIPQGSGASLGPATQDADVFPALIALRDCTPAQRAELAGQFEAALQREETPPFAVLLQSAATSDAIAHHLALQLIATSPLDGSRCLLRYYDPRVFVQLPRILSAQESAALFGPVTRWHYWWFNAWVASRALDAPAHQPAWSLAQWAGLLRIGMINRLLADMQLPLSVQEYFSRSADTDRILMRAEEMYGLTDREDLLAFARAGLRTHPQFDEHPVVAHLIAQCGNAPGALADGFALQADLFWAHVAEALRQTHGESPVAMFGV